VLEALLEAIANGLVAPFESVSEFMDAGGGVLVVIFVAGLIMWFLIVERYWYFTRELPRQREQLLAQWQARGDHRSWASRHIRKQMISQLNLRMAVTLPVMRVMVPLAPLLGLLGTVAGMLEVFDAMALKGYADARTMASGVSQAMTCTLAGLVVSISGIFFVPYFQSRVRIATELVGDALKY
jgi:biopolymer transport protein ExbB